MDDIGHLVKALIRENPYDLLMANRKYLAFANEALVDDHLTKALEAVILYSTEYGRCPENITSVIEYLVSNAKQNSAYEKTDGYRLQLEEIQDDTDEKELGASGLIEDVYQKAYTSKLTKIYSQASKITLGSFACPYTKERGPVAAKNYIREEESRLVIKKPPQMGGELRENMSHMKEYVNSFMIGDTRRVLTGIKAIDEKTLIGRRQANRWIGILGYTHHGKSLLLNTLLYNMVCNGANVLLCPRESSVENAFMQFIWLHHNKVCPDAPIVSRADWMRNGNSNTFESFNTMQIIMKDLAEGTTLPGKLVVEGCRSWEELKDKAKETNKKFDYDVLAIDYFGHLDTSGGNKKESDMEKYKKDLRDAQMLSLDGLEGDKSGLVIITPLQANKKGHDEAAKREGDNFGIYESLGAVEWFTQAAQDMDCIMSVWMEGDQYENGDSKRMLVNCMKGRNDMIFNRTVLTVNPKTGLLYDDVGGVAVKLDRDRNMNDSLSLEDIEQSLNTTVSIDSENWSR